MQCAFRMAKSPKIYRYFTFYRKNLGFSTTVKIHKVNIHKVNGTFQASHVFALYIYRCLMYCV